MPIPRNILKGVIAASLLVAGAARAAVTLIDTHALTLQRYEDYPDSGMAVAADVPGRVSLTLPLMAAQLGTAPADSSLGDPHTNTISFQSLYDVQFKPGYRITGVTMSANVLGTLSPGQGEPPGDAGNYLNIQYELWGNSTGGDISVSALHGSELASATSNGLHIDAPFLLHLSGYSTTWATSGWQYDPASEELVRTRSTAAIGVRDLTLTFTVAAVPEPGTWLMLAAGLLTLAALGRDRPA